MLPHENVSPDDLERYIETNLDKSNKKIIITQFATKDLVELKEPIEGRPFDKNHYYKNPHLYKNKFHKFLPYVSWLINGIYWEPKYCRVLTKEDLKDAMEFG